MTIDEARALYILQLLADGRSVHTRQQYDRHLGLLVRYFPEHKVEELRPVDLARFLASPIATHRADGRPRKATSVNALRSSLKTFFGYLAVGRFIPTNPAALIRRARCGSPPPKALTDGERERLVMALANARTSAERRDRVLFMTMLTAGLRLGSALGVDVGDLDLDEALVRMRTLKGGGEDVVYLPAATVELLRGFVGERWRGPLFHGRSGVRLGRRSAHRRLVLWARRAEIRRAISPHSLRHTFATVFYRRSGDIRLTAMALGHSNLSSTMVYAALGKEAVRAMI